MQSTALRFRIVAFWIVCGALVGCGSDPNAPLSDEGQVAVLIYQFSDAARAPDSFAALFAAKSLPDEAQRKKYAVLNFRPISDATCQGEEATLRVRIRDLNDQDLAELEWKAVRENGTWKLVDAPLPPP